MPQPSIWATPLIVGLILAPNALLAAEEKPPHIGWLFPAGAQRGHTVQVTLGGTDLAGAKAVRITGKGVEGKVTRAVNDKTKTLELAVAVAADAELGQREMRVETPAGMSNGFHFFVGQLPEVNEIEPNDDFAKAQTLPALPVLVNGQINRQVNGQPAADKDFFRFQAKAGQTLVFAVDARAILPYMADAVPGWLQAVLTLYDAHGKDLAYADGFRFRQDTVLIYKVPADGQYVLELRDSLYRGRQDFVYRLSMGALPYVTDVYPLGGKRGTTVPVQLQRSESGSAGAERAGAGPTGHRSCGWRRRARAWLRTGSSSTRATCRKPARPSPTILRGRPIASASPRSSMGGSASRATWITSSSRPPRSRAWSSTCGPAGSARRWIQPSRCSIPKAGSWPRTTTWKTPTSRR